MGVDHTGGTDTRTETTDKPAPSKQQNELPADNPGSPGQASRAESLARAREPAQWNGTQQTEVKESGAQPADQRNAETAESPRSGNGTQETGTPGQTGAESTGQGEDERDKGKGASESGEAGGQGRRDEEQRSQGKHTPAESKPETDGPRDRGQPGGQALEQRTETTDRPAPSQRVNALPADNPGSPGQPSRAESLARAREPAPWGDQQTETTSSTGERPYQERENDPTKAEAVSDGPANGVSGRPETEQERDAGRAVSGQGTPESGSPGRTEVHSETGENQTPTERQHSLPADNPGSPNQPSRAESLARAREPFQQESDARRAQATGQEQRNADGLPTDQNPPTSPASDAPRAAEQEPQATGEPDAEGPQPSHERIGENTEQPFGPQEGGREGTPGERKAHERAAEPLGGSEQTPQIPDGQRISDGRPSQLGEGERPLEEPGEQRTTDSPARPQEVAGREPKTAEQRDEQDGGHDRNIESTETVDPSPNEANETNPEAPQYPILTDVYIDRSGQVRVEPRYGREQPSTELSPNEPETTDPVGFPPHQNPNRTEIGTRGRGEFGSPENDPADSPPHKEEPERVSRRRESYRGIFDKPGDVRKSVDEFAAPMRDGFKRVPPTGQHAGVHNEKDQFKAPDHSLQAGNVVLALAGTTIVAIEAVRRGKNIARRLIGRNDGDH